MQFTLTKEVEETPKVVTLSISDSNKEFVDIKVDGVIIAGLTYSGALWICGEKTAKSVGLATENGRLKVIS